MRLLVLSDIHGAEEKIPMLKNEASAAQAVIVAGDLTHFGAVEDVRRILDALRSFELPLYAVAGNCDSPEIERFLAEEGVALGREARYLERFAVYGVSGALPGPVDTPYETTEEGLEELLQSIDTPPDRPLILVVHQPPYKTVGDRVMRFKHVGSRAVRRWIERHQPRLVVSGHIHESFGTETLGPSRLLNPGAFRDGRYAVVDVDPESGEVGVELKKI